VPVIVASVSASVYCVPPPPPVTRTAPEESIDNGIRSPSAASAVPASLRTPSTSTPDSPDTCAPSSASTMLSIVCSEVSADCSVVSSPESEDSVAAPNGSGKLAALIATVPAMLTGSVPERLTGKVD
jgi:hypothetical protein